MILDAIMGVFCCLLAAFAVAMLACVLWVVWWMTLQ